MIEDPKEFLGIDLSNLEVEFMEQPLKFEAIATALASANRKVEENNLILEVAEAEVATALRETACTNKEKITEKALEQKLVLNPKIQKLKYSKIQLREQKELISGLLRATEHRRDALKSLAYSIKNELPLTDGLDPDKIA